MFSPTIAMEKFVDRHLESFYDKETESERFLCRVCKDYFSTDPVFHLKTHMNATYFTCSVKSCGTMFTRFENYLQHIHETESSHAFIYTCLKCNYSGGDAKFYMDHLRSHKASLEQERRMWTQTLQDTYFVDTSTVVAKSEVIEGVENGEIISTDSEKITSRKRKRVPVNSSDGGFQCDICDVIVPFRNSRKHLADHFKNTSLCCKSCNIGWASFSYYYKHGHEVTDDKHAFLFHCKLCGIELAGKFREVYEQHLKIHAMEKVRKKKSELANPQMTGPNFSCWYCSICCFFTYPELVNHTLQHCDFATFYCLVCFESYRRYNHTMHHCNTHNISSAPPDCVGFLCNLCGFSGNCGSGILNHMSKHLIGSGVSFPADDTPFKCQSLTSNMLCFSQCRLRFETRTVSCDAKFSSCKALCAHVRQHIMRTSQSGKSESQNNNVKSKAMPLSKQENCDMNSIQNRIQSSSADLEPASKVQNAANSQLKKVGCMNNVKSGKIICDQRKNAATNSKLTTEVFSLSTSEHITDVYSIKEEPVSDTYAQSDDSLQPSAKQLKGEVSVQKERPVVQNLVGKSKIKIYVCRVCAKRFVDEHFFRQHLDRTGHDK